MLRIIAASGGASMRTGHKVPQIPQVPQHHLLPGERVLWVGRPDPRILFAPADAFLVPFSIFWAGFAFFWEGGVLFGLFRGDNPALLAFVLFGLPFVAIGLYFVAGRFAYKRYRKRRTLYVVTDRRVLRLTTTRSERLDAVFLDACPSITKRARRDGIGSISFGSVSPWSGSAMYENTGLDLFGLSRSGFAFYDIPDVEEVYRLVLTQRAGRQSGNT
jgi:hypothetical protein